MEQMAEFLFKSNGSSEQPKYPQNLQQPSEFQESDLRAADIADGTNYPIYRYAGREVEYEPTTHIILGNGFPFSNLPPSLPPPLS